MKIGGFQKFSLIDYPGKTASVIFTQGCNMFCPYCHNPQLVYPEQFGAALNEEDIFVFLKKRKGLIDGVVITGGEPTVHKDLPLFAGKIKSLGYSLKLDTNGTDPAALKLLIGEKLIDFIAMDIKAPLHKYFLFYKGDINRIKNSVSLIRGSGIDHLFRTTYDRGILDENDILAVKELVSPSLHISQECIKLFKH